MAIAKSSAPAQPVTSRTSTKPTRPMRSERPAQVRASVSPGLLNLPFVEMFGFDGANEVLGQDESVPILTTHAPHQAILARRPTGSVPISKPTRPGILSLFDALPRLSDFGTLSSAENTGTLIERLWEATDGIDALSGSWNSEPSNHSGRFPTQDRRWGLIGAVVIGIALVVLAVANLKPEKVTGPEVAPVRQAIQDAAGTVDDLVTISGYLADPATAGESLSDAAVMLAAIDHAARELSTEASALSSWEDFRPAASALSSAADQGAAIENRLGDALTYRLVSDTLFQLPGLPATANGTTSSQIGFDLATMVADAERAMSRLPRDPALTGHRLATETLAADLLPLIDRYLEALRGGDVVTAQATSGAIMELVVANRKARVDAFDQFDAEITGVANDYAAALAAAGALLQPVP